MVTDPDATALARFLQRNAPVLALTGAGVSTASGLPDFRSPGGLWERLDPMVDGHVDMLARDPGRVWQCWAEPLVGAEIQPNPAHGALAQLELGGFIGGVVTQNIDGLHHAAGSEAVEVHGHLRTAACLACGAEEEMATALARYAESRRAPECLACGATLRPQVVLFGEALPPAAWGSAAQLAQTSGGCLCVGTSLQVYPAAGLAEAFARARRPLAIVSQQPTGLWEDADPRLLRAAEELLPAVAAILIPQSP
ncbi:MAG TPA: Sir2 family NAD-dependent protein deacetylase [Gaiellales bacterium]|nr:Sir2 family NAD-dependent protein deacetylase [Gaiellales bacterium]